MKWTDSNERFWLQEMTGNAGTDLIVFDYDHGQIPSENFSWQCLIDKGNTFIVDLLELSESEKVTKDDM